MLIRIRIHLLVLLFVLCCRRTIGTAGNKMLLLPPCVSYVNIIILAFDRAAFILRMEISPPCDFLFLVFRCVSFICLLLNLQHSCVFFSFVNKASLLIIFIMTVQLIHFRKRKRRSNFASRVHCTDDCLTCTYVIGSEKEGQTR